MRICAVVPCYRARRHILDVLRRLLPYVEHVFVVDDACPEGTGDLVASSYPASDKVSVIRNPVNRGVGGATIAGYEAALSAGFEVMVKLDADGQMDPAYIPALVQPILDGTADYAKGNRFYRHQYLRRMKTMRLFGNSVLSFMTKASSGYWGLMDPTNGFTALHATAANEIGFEKIAQRYFFESDMLFRLNIARAVVRDVPMPAIYGSEISNLNVLSALLTFPFLHLRNAGKRFVYSYLLRDFNVGTIQAIAGACLMAFGVIFGATTWISNAEANISTPVGTVMLATLPIILGFQLLLSALSFDISNVPTHPLQIQLKYLYQASPELHPGATEQKLQIPRQSARREFDPSSRHEPRRDLEKQETKPR